MGFLFTKKYFEIEVSCMILDISVCKKYYWHSIFRSAYIHLATDLPAL